MLKIRIAGSESELRQIAHKTGGATRIKRFKRENGKTSFAIDVEISVADFLDNLDLNATEKTLQDNNTQCDAREIQAQLESLLQEISDN